MIDIDVRLALSCVMQQVRVKINRLQQSDASRLAYRLVQRLTCADATSL